MSIIQAYKSDEDGVLFEHQKDYIAHLRKLARKKSDEKKKQKQLDDFEQKISDMFSTCLNEQDINRFLEENKDVFIFNPYGSPPSSHKKMNYKIQIKDLRFVENIANTHCAPLGMPTNFGQKNNLPKNYPGWRGTIVIQDDVDYCFESHWLYKTGINTGSGGSTSTDGILQYELTLYAHDFKAMFMQEFIDEVHKADYQSTLSAYSKASTLMKYPELIRDGAEFIEQMDCLMPILRTAQKFNDFFSKFDDFVIEYDKFLLEYKLKQFDENNSEVFQNLRKPKI